MFDFDVLHERSVRVLLKDGTWCTGAYRTILREWAGSTPMLWVSDWSQDHYVPLDRIQQLETS